MPLWNNNDREDSKPTWLTAAQKRYCVRTNAGWEIPTANGIANLANQFEGTRLLSATGNASGFAQPQMQLLVAMPNDPAYSTGITSATSSAYANRPGITGGWTGGLVSGLVSHSPYISAPFSGDGATSGGPNGLGLNHSETGNYGVNGYGVSTLYWGTASVGITGSTGYIKVKANDANFTDTLTLSLTAAFNNVTPSAGALINYGGPTGATATRPITFVTGVNLLTTAGPTGIPTAVYEAFFGPTSAYNQDIGIIILPVGLTTGAYGLTAFVNDGSTGSSVLPGIGATGVASFKFTVR
jgi:hypothetical protein